jgi:hypothetical protein
MALPDWTNHQQDVKNESHLSSASIAGVKRSRLFELALVLVRFDYGASLIVNANHCIMVSVAK